MKRVFLVWMVVTAFLLINSCKNEVKEEVSEELVSENQILQGKDGTISLQVNMAECYHDMKNPSSNTAEWHVLVSKSGRFNVWMSSATKDTTNLRYTNSVMLSFLDNRLEAFPACDRIIQDSGEVDYPFFRADSFIGSLYIQDTGLFNIQLVSEKIIPQDYKSNDSSDSENSRLLSVFLTPIIR